MFAVIQTGGKQYKVSPGDVIFIEKLEEEDNAAVEFDVLMVSSDAGVQIGAPTVSGVKVQAKVICQGKNKKIVVYKYKAKKNYRRKMGHRQTHTRLEITAIAGV